MQCESYFTSSGHSRVLDKKEDGDDADNGERAARKVARVVKSRC